MQGPKHASSSVLAAAREIFDGCSDGLVGLHQIFLPLHKAAALSDLRGLWLKVEAFSLST